MEREENKIEPAEGLAQTLRNAEQRRAAELYSMDFRIV